MMAISLTQFISLAQVHWIVIYQCIVQLTSRKTGPESYCWLHSRFRGFNVFADNMIKLSVNKTKWTGLLPTCRSYALTVKPVYNSPVQTQPTCGVDTRDLNLGHNVGRRLSALTTAPPLLPTS